MRTILLELSLTSNRFVFSIAVFVLFTRTRRSGNVIIPRPGRGGLRSKTERVEKTGVFWIIRNVERLEINPLPSSTALPHTGGEPVRNGRKRKEGQ